jgi:3-dehydroquinate dehydratase type I
VNAKICVSISSTDTSKLLGRARRAETLSADLIEVRLDKLRSSRGLSKVARSVETPLIATNRPFSERGSFDGSEADRLKDLVGAVEDGFSYVDLELRISSLSNTIDTFRKKGARIILSHHDFFHTPSTSRLESTKTELEKYRPDLCKIVTTARSSDDNLTVLNLLNKNRQTATPLVSFAMGDAGVWSRVMAPYYGAAFTYASLGRGLETAPGQPAVSDLRRIYQTLGLE